MKEIIITIVLGIISATAQVLWTKPKYDAKQVEYDKDINGYRYIQTGSLTVLMPKRSEFWTSICISYYEGYKNPYYIRLYSRCELSKKDILILKFANGKEMHLYAEDSNYWRSNLGIGKKVDIYDAIYLLDVERLDELFSSPVTGIMVGYGSKWHSKEFEKNEIGEFLKSNYDTIHKRLEKKGKK